MKRRDISLDQIKKLMRFKPTLKDCACMFDCSEDTISRKIEKETGLNFFDFRDRYLGDTRIKLQQKAIQMALAGDRVMLIFSLKNMAGWKDNPDVFMEQEPCHIEIAYE